MVDSVTSTPLRVGERTGIDPALCQEQHPGLGNRNPGPGAVWTFSGPGRRRRPRVSTAVESRTGATRVPTLRARAAEPRHSHCRPTVAQFSGMPWRTVWVCKKADAAPLSAVRASRDERRCDSRTMRGLRRRRGTPVRAGRCSSPLLIEIDRSRRQPGRGLSKSRRRRRPFQFPRDGLEHLVTQHEISPLP
jgi:hypothetical protein